MTASAAAAHSSLHEAILASASYAIIATAPDGVITHFNRAAERMLGYSAAELVGRVTPAMLHDPQEVVARAHAFQQMLGIEVTPDFDVFVAKTRMGLPNEHVWTYIRKDGGRLSVHLAVTPIVDAEGRIEGYLGVADDITERLTAEAARRSSEEKLRSLFELSPLGLALADLDGRFIEFNRAFQEICGYDADELAQLGYWDLTPTDYAAQEEIQLEALRRTGRYGPYEKEYIRKDGSRVPLRLNGAIVTGSDGRDYIWSIVEDISEPRRQKAMLRAAMERAEAANRAKSDFLANISHEVRTPLNGVIGLAGALARTNLVGAQVEMVQVIRKSGEALERLLSELLDVSKMEAGRLDLEIAPFDLLAEVGVAVELVRSLAVEKNLRLEVDVGADVAGWYLGDGVRVRQIVSNLLSNAVKFTAEGEVRVRLAAGDEGADGSVPVMIQVVDTGMGVPEALLPRLFEPFTQADESITRRFGGTGLGLAICRDLASLMGGDIAAVSCPGQGSTFTVSLPLSRTDARPASVAPQPAASLADKSLQVLLVEDHVVNRKVVELILQDHPFKLSFAENGRAGLEAFAAVAFDVVLMDMQMPVMDGLSATRAIRALEAQEGRDRTPVVMLTANALQTHKDQAVAAGADAFLSKPITPESLMLCLEKVLLAEA